MDTDVLIVIPTIHQPAAPPHAQFFPLFPIPQCNDQAPSLSGSSFQHKTGSYFQQSGFESNPGISQDLAGAGSGEFFATFVKTIQVIFNLLRLLFLVQHRQSLHKLGDAENRKLAGSPFAQKVSG